MQSLIIYQSKYGTSEKCANLIKDQLVGDVSILNVKDVNYDDLLKADTIIIGGSIYMGKILKGIRKLCKKYLDLLVKKNIGLFTCSLKEGEEAIQQLENNFPTELVNVAKVTDSFGGEITYKKLNFFYRKIIDMVSKSKDATFSKMDENKNISTLNYERIKEFSDNINLGTN